MQSTILDLAKPELNGRMLLFDKASAEIQELITKAKPTTDILSAIKEAYAELGDDNPAVAVRS